VFPVPVLFVHHRRELGGAPESLAYLIRELDRTHFEPHVFAPEGPSAELFRSAGASVHPGTVATFTHIWASTYRGPRWLLLGRELARLPSHSRDLRRTLRFLRPALVHVNDSPALPAARIARAAGIPVILHLRSALPERGGALRSHAIRRAVRTFANATIAINEDVAASFAVGSTVVPNGVDLDRFRPGSGESTRRELGLPGDRAVVSSFGFLYPSKGFRELLGAASLLRSRGLDATYLLVGGGVRPREWFASPAGRMLRLAGVAHDHEAEARADIGRLGLDDAVRIVPYRRDVAELYRASDIVVAPSQGPELGRSVVEAAATGLPVVATGSSTGGGIVVPGRTGLLADAGADGIADAVGLLLADPERRRELGRAAREHAEARFDPAANARAIELVYTQLLR
jgi:glycosyltransferase involved in cell wall biosynthesis